MRNFFISVLILINSIPLLARGGGGCVEKGTLILTPYGYKAVETLKENDEIISYSTNRYNKTKIKRIYLDVSDNFAEIQACGKSISVTETHPFMVSDGRFKKAVELKKGDEIYIYNGKETKKCGIEKKIINNKKDLIYNILAYPYETYIADGFVVHNKGCFLPDTMITNADGSRSKISEIKEGDLLLSFDENGKILKTTVKEILKLKTFKYYTIETDLISLSATAEHPFYAGDGVFRTVESLKNGDTIYLYDGRDKLMPQRIKKIEEIKKYSYIYNLKTDFPNTFFANYVAVHNKGGGCFPLGTKISTPYGKKNIEDIKIGDKVYSYTDEKLVESTVNDIIKKKDKIFEIEAEGRFLKTTYEHPLLTTDGFKEAGNLKAGDRIASWDNELKFLIIKKMTLNSKPETVYNLSVEYPNTFIADGFIVHNKGSFGGGGYHSHYHSSNDKNTSKTDMVISIIIIIFIFVLSATSNGKDEGEELDYLFSRSDIEKKSKKTEKLINFISQQDKNFDIAYIKNTVSNIFLKLEECWQKRDYDPMKDLLTQSLYIKHTSQIDMMIKENEINIIDDLKIVSIDIVGLRYTAKEDGCFFTALITAEAKDYYIDDRNNNFLRGERTPKQFQEFWIFKLIEGKWLLDEIEQTAESDELTKEDFVEQFTDNTLSQIYGEDISNVGPKGPVIPEAVVDKGNKIMRMINFLGETDKLWNLSLMEVSASLAFIKVYQSWAASDPLLLNNGYISEQMAKTISSIINEKKNEGYIFEFRNLCIRKVDIVLVYNMADDGKDEFTVRFSAHAQKRVIRNGNVIFEDKYVMPFTEYWNFAKEDNKWKAKEILPRVSGEKAVYAMNKDEDSSPAQLEWYYTKKRTY
ncbi:MAG: TIM44-like domain-containing protein [Elusimicrobiales bacterium]|nr:TIM44-like domain-containing protein [Elusimicrobiales bacterium]